MTLCPSMPGFDSGGIGIFCVVDAFQFPCYGVELPLARIQRGYEATFHLHPSQQDAGFNRVEILLQFVVHSGPPLCLRYSQHVAFAQS